MMSRVMSTEERLRAATRAAAATVPPGSAPPLRLPRDLAGEVLRGLGTPFPAPSLARPFTPLAAAAAVAAVVIASLTLASGMHGTPAVGRTRPRAPRRSAACRPTTWPSPACRARQTQAVIRATTTGEAWRP